MRARFGIVAFWLLATGWLIRYEAFPQHFTGVIAGYRSFLSGEVPIRDSWSRVLYQGVPLGYSYLAMDVNEKDAVHHYNITNSMQLRLTLMGESHNIFADTTAILDAACRIQQFRFVLSSGAISFSVDGVRTRQGSYNVRILTGGKSRRLTVGIPEDVIIATPIGHTLLKQLKVGQEVAMRVFDPLTLQPARVLLRALRNETIVIGRRKYETTVLSVETKGHTALCWLDQTGNLIRQETPYGWALETCSPREAFDAVVETRTGEDILGKMAVRCSASIHDPRNCRFLKLRLRGLAFAPEELATHRQEVESAGHEGLVLVLRADQMPAESGEYQPLPDAAELLAASQMIQADDPDIKSQAGQIVTGKMSPREKALALSDWVWHKLAKRPVAAVPSAIETLRRLEGDCTEHTYLFVALARAAGLPARVVVGVAYNDGMFYYHAWPAVFVGRWVELDPTWGQIAGVDATHLALAVGELADQMKLLRALGKLELDVLEQSSGIAETAMPTGPDG